MNIKKFIYEFLGFATFYSFAGLILGFDSTITCIILGIIGAVAGKFVSKVNGFFIDEIIEHEIVNENEGNVDVEFTLKADYKIKPIILFGSYTANKMFDTQTLSTLLYNEFYDSHYKQVLNIGLVSIKVGLKEEIVEIKIKN